MRKQLTRSRVLLYVRLMPQRSNHLSIATTNRLATVDGLLLVLGTSLLALLALVLLITNGGAG